MARHRADEALKSRILEFIAKSGERTRTERKHTAATAWFLTFTRHRGNRYLGI